MIIIHIQYQSITPTHSTQSFMTIRLSEAYPTILRDQRASIMEICKMVNQVSHCILVLYSHAPLISENPK